jgi:uncharacterized protein
MLDIIFHRDVHGRPSGFSARGHTDFAEHGEDIVCAAVSAILQAARLGLEAYARIELDVRQRPGELRLAVPEGSRNLESARAILATAELALEQIAARFPDHVLLKRREIAGRMTHRRPGRVTSPADRKRGHDV